MITATFLDVPNETEVLAVLDELARAGVEVGSAWWRPDASLAVELPNAETFEELRGLGVYDVVDGELLDDADRVFFGLLSRALPDDRPAPARLDPDGPQPFETYRYARETAREATVPTRVVLAGG